MRTSDRRSQSRARLTRKDLKAPDEFVTFTGRVLSFTTQHLQSIGLILGGVIACAIGIWGVLTYVRGIEQDAFTSLWHIEGQLRSAGETGAVPPAALERLGHITQQFGAGDARGYAWLYLGHARYQQGDYPAAMAAYQEAMSQVQPSELLWSLASLGTAYALEARGEFKQAQAAYQRVIDAKPAGLIMEAYLGKGRTAELSNDVETTIIAYSAVIEQFPARAGALDLADRVEMLKARR